MERRVGSHRRHIFTTPREARKHINVGARFFRSDRDTQRPASKLKRWRWLRGKNTEMVKTISHNCGKETSKFQRIRKWVANRRKSNISLTCAEVSVIKCNPYTSTVDFREKVSTPHSLPVRGSQQRGRMHRHSPLMRSLFSQFQTPTAPRRAVGFFRSGCPSGCPAWLITQSTSGQQFYSRPGSLKPSNVTAASV